MNGLEPTVYLVLEKSLKDVYLNALSIYRTQEMNDRFIYHIQTDNFRSVPQKSLRSEVVIEWS